MNETDGALAPDFWKGRRLEDLDAAEWEALCDGCGWCCLHKIEYEDSDEVDYTAVACRLLDLDTCRCRDYERRREVVDDCFLLTPAAIRATTWLPDTCAYRRVAEGRPLPSWHPLRTGDPESVHESGHSVRHRAIPESAADTERLEAYIIEEIPGNHGE